MIHNRPGRWRRLALVASLCMLATACTGGQQPFRPSYPQSGLSIAAPISPRPNIVFILTDDLSMNLLPYMPHVQALALRGMTFKDYFVVDSFCCPSRASIFTGQYPHDTGVFTNGGADGGYAGYNHFGNPPKSFAIGLRRAGYRTGFMGKYFNGYDPRFKPAPGWDTWFGVGDGYRAFDYWVNDDGKRTHYGSRPQDFLNSVMTTKASNFIESARGAGKPFALELATFSPHKPYAAAPRDVGTFPTVTAPRGPAFGRAPANAPAWLQWMPRFTASDVQSLDLAFRQRVESVQSVDRMIEELERELIKTGELRNTYFVFSSDNGLHLGEHRMLAGKTTAFDTDIKVPLIVAGPGVPAGSTVSAMASSIDLAPTFLQIAGARPTDR
ncbi:MAG TPA: sulfatase, partial [Jatrophihabitans sp.]|nr:sulfatase [Jatrophihabitans sp.]